MRRQRRSSSGGRSGMGTLNTSNRMYLGTTTLADDSAEWSTRLSALALFYAVGFVVAYGVTVVALERVGAEVFTRFDFHVGVISVLLASTLFVLARWRLVGDRWLNRIALAWLTPAVAGSLLAEDWSWHFANPGFTGARSYIGISYACVVLVVYPLIVRATVRQIFVASGAAAMLSSAAVLAHGLYRGGEVKLNVLVAIGLPLLICAAMSLLPATIMVRYRRRLAAARRLGSYQLEERLGHGGMGEVWSARHELLARPAAIKVIHPDALRGVAGDTDDANRTLRRFEREVQATASLQSPHTVSVYDFGHTGDGTFYYVMERLEGVDAQRLVDRFGPLPAERTIALLKQVCHSLDEAHHRNLIHRDIKPANLFVCRLGRDVDYVKVLDFGLVKDRQGADAAEPDLSIEGFAAGTPAYMAPEVATGEADVDGRSDLYSLGCVAYWLLTGKRVFEADTPVALALKHVRETPVPPSACSELHIPRELERVVLKCLAKRPGDRPRSAAALSRMLDGCEVEDRWSPERARKWWEVHLPEGSVEVEGAVLNTVSTRQIRKQAQ